MIIVNFKNYKHGDEILKLAKLIEKHNKNIIIAVPAPYISLLSQKTKLKVFAQHADSYTIPQSTGYILPQDLKAVGASGVILNHAEHQISFQEARMTVHQCKKEGLMTVVCATHPREAKQILTLKPTAIAYENPSYIGKSNSFSQRLEEMKKFILNVKGSGVIPIVGAGVSSEEDLKQATKLGYKGVILASAVANSSEAENFLKFLKKYR